MNVLVNEVLDRISNNPAGNTDHMTRGKGNENEEAVRM